MARGLLLGMSAAAFAASTSDDISEPPNIVIVPWPLITMVPSHASHMLGSCSRVDARRPAEKPSRSPAAQPPEKSAAPKDPRRVQSALTAIWDPPQRSGPAGL